jgi:predicted RND superfamily exporter protein
VDDGKIAFATGDKKSALRFAMGHSGFAIVMTSLTTAAGMWSFAFSDVAPVADLGIFASASIALGLLFVLIFLPAMLATLKLKHKPVASHNKTMDTFLYKVFVKYCQKMDARPSNNSQ